MDPQLNALLPSLKETFEQFSKQECLGHIELVKAANATVLVVRHTQKLTEKDQSTLTRFAESKQLSLFLIPNSGQLVQVTGEKPYYTENNCKVAFSPDSFIQVNQNINQQMVNQAIEWLTLNEQDRVLDLFCGVGNFSLPIAKVASKVVGVEGVPAMVEQANANADLNLITNAKFFHANLEENIDTAEWSQEKI